MQLDSKESDIEQLRRKILDLQQGMDCTSVASLQTDEADGNVSGKRKCMFELLDFVQTHSFGRYCSKQVTVFEYLLSVSFYIASPLPF